MEGRRRFSTLTVVVALVLIPQFSLAVTDSNIDRALALLGNGQPAEALIILHEFERQLPNPQAVWGLLGAGYLQLGWQRLNQGDEAAAREAFAQARHYLPDDPRPLRATALAWLHGGEPAAAVGPLHEALVLSEEDAELWLLLGRAYYALGDLVQAEEAWMLAAQSGSGEAASLLEKVRRDQRAEHVMTRTLGGRFIVGYAPQVSEALADAVLKVLQEAYQDVGQDLGFYPEVDIPVLLYAGEDFTAVTRSPTWAGAVYDGKIRVPLGGVQRMTPPLRDLLRHEYAHVLVRFLGKGKVPVWLNEGIAQLVESREGQTSEKPPGQVLSSAVLEQPFTELSAELVPVAYAQSRKRVAHMVSACGWSALGELLQNLGNGLAWERAVAAAYAPCGLDWPRLEAGFQSAPN